MRFWRRDGPKPEGASREIRKEPLCERELRPEEACGEMRAEIILGKGYPGAFQRARLAFFVMRKFHDPAMAAASFIPPGRHGAFLKEKDSAFINRCNLYDFYKAAERYLAEYSKDRNPGALRCFCEHFLKVERYERLHAPRSMSEADERRLAQDRLRYLRALNGRLGTEVEEGRIARLEVEVAMARSGRYLAGD